MSRKQVRDITTAIISAVLLAASLLLLVNKQQVADTYANLTYTPSAEITTIGERTKLTDKARFTFHATKPEVLDQAAFNTSCPRQEVGSPILGCYTAEDRIYMYNVTEKSLDGLKEVTAVHEMLHAVWQRTPESQRQSLGELLKKAYDQHADEALKTRMDYYQRTEPGEFTNELHSILGTETANLGPELEKYYNQYFDRSAVLALHEKYNATYTALNTRATELFDEMKKLSTRIEVVSASYTAASESYAKEVDSFNARAAAGDFTSMTLFNYERSRLVARGDELEAQRQAVNADIETYNKYHEEYQQIAKQIETLNNGMDSYHTIDKAPSV